MMSKELGNFYVAYQNWLSVGAPSLNEYSFDRYVGLCSNLIGFGSCDNSSLELEMIEQFIAARLDKSYPFNNADRLAYVEEANKSKCHLNPIRIDWVRTKAAEFLAQGE